MTKNKYHLFREYFLPPFGLFRLPIITATLLSLLFSISGCFVKKELAKKKIIPDKSPEIVFEELKKNELRFEWLSLKANAKTTVNGKSNSFKINIRIRKDSLIWMSVSSIMGVEAARVEITPDTIKLIDKINSVYYISDIDSLSEKFDVDADFETLQSLFIGNSIDLNDSLNLMISVQKGDYLLSTIKKRKLKRIIRKNEKKGEKMEKKSSSNDAEKRIDRVKKSARNEKDDDKDDMILQSLWVDAELFKITRISINDLKTNHSLIAEYDNFILVENQQVAHQAKFSSASRKNMKMALEYTKITLNIPQSFPFNISEEYERRY